MSETLYVVMPAYNEENNIEAVVREWYEVLQYGDAESRLVVADSGSVDKTHEILTELQKEMGQLSVLHTDNQYHGPKVLALYDYAIKNGADYIFQTDSDGQTNPKEFASFWAMRNKYDGIFGNRTVRGDGKDRAFVERVVCFLLRIYFGVSVPDANAPFRLMKSSIVKKYLSKLPGDYNLPNIMMTTFFVYYKEKYCFKVISFKERRGGENSINIKNIFLIGVRVLGDFLKLKREL